ncbi:uncharacterized protein OCT59_000565 [Rhizophagus irregularis]|uniref:uncharacterized protein n=1 Tax=Rhizophagus irregularis TaxID=588596 RepID=UPI000CBB6873|nr:hypothetical protein OCT59_000565 [Rhizophagus irregularis]CAB4493476.1 unnamed protein product [Rhizophagus irregularis]
MQEEMKFSNLLIQRNFRSGNINNTYYKKRLKLIVSVYSQSTSHSEKDKLALVSYDYDTHLISYEAYLSAKATIAENTIPSTPKFEPACISVTSAGNQEMIPPTSYQSSNCKSDTGEIFI